jgi:signal transduction histidine kinase
MTPTKDASAGHGPRWWRAWIGDLVAAVLIVGPAAASYPGHDLLPGNPLGFAAAVAPAAILPLRRRWPIPILAACIALFAIAAFTGALGAGTELATAIAVFGVAVRTDRRTTLVTAVVTAVLLVGIGLLSGIASPFEPRTFQYAFTIGFAAAAGEAIRSRRAYIAAITERAVRAEETRESEARRRVAEDRLRIARDLHDAVAHQISVISLNAGVASSALESRPEAAREALATIRSAARAVLGEIGDLLAMLRAGDSGGASDAAGAAPQPGLDRLDELMSRFRESGLDVTLRVDGDVTRLPVATDLVAYRVLQEALTNAHKHGAEHRAHILVDVRTDSARLVVTNPVATGGGAAATASGAGHGLLGIRERVASVRGTVEAGPAPGGYRLTVTLPLPAATDVDSRHPSLDSGTDDPG